MRLRCYRYRERALSRRPETCPPAAEVLEPDSTYSQRSAALRRQDEIGTPFCVTVDFDTLDDQAVTVRERDSMTQERVSEDKVTDYLAQRLVGC